MCTSRRPIALLSALVAVACVVSAATRYPVKAMILSADPERKSFVASIETIPGFMQAMTMPFQVRDAKELAGLAPGAIVEFTLVVEGHVSYVEAVKIRRFETVEQDPLNARRLALMRDIATGAARRKVPVGALVPDFRLTDQKGQPFALSSTRGKIVGVNFMYTTCQLPDYCLRIVNHFGALQKTFQAALGRDLVLVTITFDPVRDTPEVLDRYSAQWKPNPRSWHFLTGDVRAIQPVLDAFGVAAFPNEGLFDHALHTAIIDRAGRLVANVEGNQFSTDQLSDLFRSELAKKR